MKKPKVPKAIKAFEWLQKVLEERANEPGAECPPLYLLEPDEIPAMRYPEIVTRYPDPEAPEDSGIEFLAIRDSHYAEPSNAKFTYCGLVMLPEITLESRFANLPECLDLMNIYKTATWVLPESFQCPRCFNAAQMQDREEGDRNFRRYVCRSCDWPMVLILRPTLANAAALYLSRTPGKLRKTRLRSGFC